MRFLRKTGSLAVAAFFLFAILACGDYYRPVANPIISGGGQPQQTYYAYVVNSNPTGPGSITQIDVSGDTASTVTSMGNGSVAEAFPPSSDALFVANTTNDTVSEFLPIIASAVTTITLPAGSHPVYVSSAQDGLMYVINSGASTACPSTGSISVIPVATLSVSNTICLGHNPTTMVQAANGGYIYVINQADNSISLVAPGGASLVGTITAANGLGSNPVSLTSSIDGNWIFVVTQGDGVHPGVLDIIANGSGAITGTMPLGVDPTYSIVDPNLNRLYVTNTGDNTVSVFNASNVDISSSTPIPLLATVSVGTNPIGVAPLLNGTKFYTANSGSNDVTVVSANSYSVLSTISLGATPANPVWITSDPGSSKVYVANQATTSTAIIQTSNDTLVLNIPAPPQVSTCSSSCPMQVPQMIVTQ